MLAAGGGSIVNVASVNAFYHPDGLVIDYGAAKAALLNVAKALSQELGPRGIRINSVSPGPVETDRPLQHAGGGRGARGRARVAPHVQRDRLQLRDRRRARQDDVRRVFTWWWCLRRWSRRWTTFGVNLQGG